MHSESTTDLSILYSNLRSQPENQNYVVLIKTGSLNPIHRSHVSNMVRAKEYLEREHKFNVIGGYISPSHDEYVEAKLDKEFIHGQHRIEMCKKAIKEAGQQHWLSVDMAECMAPEFIDMASITLSLQMFINQKLNLPKPVRVIYVAGLDLFNRCWGLRKFRAHPFNGVAVISRPGQEEKMLASTNALHDPLVYYITVNDDDMDSSTSDTEDISSTLIRKRLKENKDCQHLTFQSVLDHMEVISAKKN